MSDPEVKRPERKWIETKCPDMKRPEMKCSEGWSGNEYPAQKWPEMFGLVWISIREATTPIESTSREIWRRKVIDIGKVLALEDNWHRRIIDIRDIRETCGERRKSSMARQPPCNLCHTYHISHSPVRHLADAKVSLSSFSNGIYCWHLDVFFPNRNRKVRKKER